MLIIAQTDPSRVHVVYGTYICVHVCTHAILLLNQFLLMCALFFDVLSHLFVFMDKQNPNSYRYIHSSLMGYVVCSLSTGI